MKKFDEYPILAVTSDDESYPFGMRKMSNNSVIYYKGNISLISATKNIAVIGTRKISDRGRKLAYETGCILAKRKITLVNGLALGCDAEAIKGALSEGGKCIVVMPCGLEQVQPRSNYRLAEQILEKGGCMISEYPVGSSIQKYRYVERDKVQSEISQGIMIIEADENSGTMHTAEFAMRQHKRLACYYHKMIELSKGNLLLENSGKAKVIKTQSDLEEFIDIVGEEKEFQQLTLL